MIDNALHLAAGVSSHAMGSPRLAENQRRYRQRQLRPARCVLRVEIRHADFLDALARSGRLPSADAWRRDLVELAASEIIDRWISEALK